MTGRRNAAKSNRVGVRDKNNGRIQTNGGGQGLNQATITEMRVEETQRDSSTKELFRAGHGYRHAANRSLMH